VSITLVNAGPLWGDGEAARGLSSAAAGFAVGESAFFPPFAEVSSPAETLVLDAVTSMTASTK
jgi:hypothetical protein